MKWEMEIEEIEAVLEKIWDLHDKLSDAIHSISRTHFLNSIKTLKKPEKKKPFNDVVDENRSGFVFVKDFRVDVDESAVQEAKSLNAIRTALENLEDQLEFFHYENNYANKRTRGAFIAAVFAMQGVGIIFAGLVSMILSRIFLNNYPANEKVEQKDYEAQSQADFLWRIVLMLGAFPALLTYYWRMKMPETGRYTAIIEGNAKQAAADMGRVLEIEIQAEQDKLAQFKAANEYPLLSMEFFHRHGLHLIGTMSTWFLLDIAFYSQNLTQKDIFPAMKLTKEAGKVDAIREMFETSRAMFVVALLGTFPGYWFTVFFIEKIGRFKIQLVGFFFMSLFMFVIGIKYDYLIEENKWLFAVLYGLTFFFVNFGPNSTTFVLPAELFPTQVRSTCHALSAAAGKAGAMVGAFGVQNYTLDGQPPEIKKAMIFMAFTNMLGFFCTFLVTETKGRSLEEISGEDGGQTETSRHEGTRQGNNLEVI